MKFSMHVISGFISGLLCFIMIIIFDHFVSGIKAQLIGSVISIVFLVNIIIIIAIVMPQ